MGSQPRGASLALILHPLPFIRAADLLLDRDLRSGDLDPRSGDLEVFLPGDFDTERRSPDLDLRSADFDLRSPDLDLRSPDLDLRSPDLDLRSPDLDRRSRDLERDCDLDLAMQVRAGGDGAGQMTASPQKEIHVSLQMASGSSHSTWLTNSTL